MKDKHGIEIYKGDIVEVAVPSIRNERDNYSLPFDFTGVVQSVKTFRTGYTVGDAVNVLYRSPDTMDFVETISVSKYLRKLSQEDAMLWKLENE